jgi:DNA gyrase subunit A
MDVVEPDQDLLVVTEKGYAKRTPLAEYNLQRRNGSGVRTLTNNLSRTGGIIGVRVVSKEGDLTIISRDGMVLRTAIIHISQLGRATQGTRVMKLKGDDVVASVAVITSKDKQAPTDDDQKNIKFSEQQSPPALSGAEAAAEIPSNGQGD